jgi:alpha-L-arabinofuranosidase
VTICALKHGAVVYFLTALFVPAMRTPVKPLLGSFSVLLLLLLPLLIAENAVAGCSAANARLDSLEIRAASRTIIEACSDDVVREKLPATLFGFNVHHHHFENDIWDKQTSTVPTSVISDLREFPGALYRYPGGLAANNYAWQYTIGPVAKRKPQKSVKWAEPASVLFGVDEYLSFVESVGGQPWFVLNLAGWDATELFPELSSDAVAANNADLAKHVLAQLGKTTPRYYQLGNELDRADYQWPTEKYVARASATIEAMSAVDPDARFVAFLREFDWTYKGPEKARGVSRFEDFIKDVLTGLPTVNDFSMHFYYDAPNAQKMYQRIPWRLQQFKRAIEVARDVRKGETPNVWITEHARGIDFGGIKARDARPFTSNLAAAVSTADFLIALAQIPEVQGASWHGLNALPWQLFDPENNLQPNPVYWALRVLKASEAPQVLATYTRSSNLSSYQGGYDTRAVVLSDPDSSNISVWVVNRATTHMQVELNLADWAGKQVGIKHRYISGPEGEDPDKPGLTPTVELEPKTQAGQFAAIVGFRFRVDFPGRQLKLVDLNEA